MSISLHVVSLLRGSSAGKLEATSILTEGETVVARGWLTTSNAHRALVHQLVLRGHGVGRFLDWADMPEVAAGALLPADRKSTRLNSSHQ